MTCSPLESRVYEEAVRWLADRAAAPAPVGLLAEFNRQFADRLEHAGPPVGKEARRLGTELAARLYRLATDVAGGREIDQVLIWAARSGCVPRERARQALEALLRQRSVSDAEPALLLRMARRVFGATPSSDPNLQSAVRRRVEEWLSCEPTAHPTHARSVARVGLLAVSALGEWPAAARQIAIGLCAENRGPEAAPWIEKAARAGQWPGELTPLLAYPRFARGDDAATAALADHWPEQCGPLGPAESGARFRCGISLLRLGDVPRGEQVLRNLPASCARLAIPALTIGQLWSGGATIQDWDVSVTARGWKDRYWNAAAAMATQPPAEYRAFLLPLLAEASPEAQRWTRELLQCRLRRDLQDTAWEAAAELCRIAADHGHLLLPAAYEAWVGLLGKQSPAQAAWRDEWLWQARAERDPEALLRAAAAAVLCGSPEAFCLTRHAYEAIPTGSGLAQAAQQLVRALVEKSDAQDLSLRVADLGGSARWRRCLYQEALSYLQRGFATGDVDAWLERAPQEPLWLDPHLEVFQRLLQGDLEALPAHVADLPEPDSLRSYLTRALADLALSAECGAQTGPLLEEFEASIQGQPSPRQPRALKELAEACVLGAAEFRETWRKHIVRRGRGGFSSLARLLLPHLSEPSSADDLIQVIQTAAPPTWGPEGPMLPIPYRETDLSETAFGCSGRNQG